MSNRIEVGDVVKVIHGADPFYITLPHDLIFLVIDISFTIEDDEESDTLVKLICLDGRRPFPWRADYRFFDFELEKIS